MFDMGQYASFIWSGWGITALALVVMAIWVWRERSNAKRKART